ncbi:MAG: sulfite exporter TauE/SafE family protein [Deltaproteobacteria bacterium]|nr:sulfite exporter TauE/SafE family protein [Deltaproteobacteria bacterium]
MPAIALPLAFVVGVVLGMLGGGGAVLMVPMLVYVVHLDAKRAIATSLFVIGLTSAISAGLHARRGNVRWKTAATFGVGSMSGAFAGGRAAHFFEGRTLLVAFAVMMLATAVAMLRGRREAPAGDARATNGRALRVIGLGLAVGFVSGLVGAGGGFLIVPALTIFAGLETRHAIGTSLAVIAAQSAAGFLGHLGGVSLDYSAVLAIAGVTAVGSIVGTFAGARVSPAALRRVFGVLVLLVGLASIAKEISPLVALGAAAACATLFVILRPRPSVESCTTSPPSPRS